MRHFIRATVLLLSLGLAGCGEPAAAARSWNQAVTALAAGDAQAAEIAAELAAARGGAAYIARRDFLLATTAFRRSVAAEARAAIPGAALAAYDRALNAAEEARRNWQRAIEGSAQDWPAARRNLERSMIRIALLQKLRDEALLDPSASRLPPPTPQDSPSSERLLERLGQQEEQKRILRRASTTLTSGAAERDW